MTDVETHPDLFPTIKVKFFGMFFVKFFAKFFAESFSRKVFRCANLPGKPEHSFYIPTSNIRSTHLPGQWQDYRGTGEVCQVTKVIKEK